MLLRKARSLGRMPASSMALIVPAWVLLGVARALILVLAFRRLSSWLGTPIGVQSWIPLIDGDQEARAGQIGRIVRLAARYTPWESKCLPQAIAARVLLGCYGVPYAFFFGLHRSSGANKTHAHAWVAAGRIRVTGGAGFDRYTVVGGFVGMPQDGGCERR